MFERKDWWQQLVAPERERANLSTVMLIIIRFIAQSRMYVNMYVSIHIFIYLRVAKESQRPPLTDIWDLG